MRPLTPRERIIVTVGAALAVLIPLYLFVFQPQTATLAILNRQIQVKTRDLAEMERVAARLPEAKRLHAAEIARLRAIERMIPSNIEVSDLVALMSRAIDASGVQLIEIAFPQGARSLSDLPAGSPASPASPAPSLLQELDFSLQIRGLFADIVALMDQVETLPRLVEVRTMDVSDTGGPAGAAPVLTVTLGMKTFALR